MLTPERTSWMDHQSAQQLLRKAELPARHHIGSGMEGHVFRVSDDTVAKVWFTAPSDHVRKLQAFYAAVLELRLPFMTPIIDDVLDIDGATVSVDAMLAGTPLDTFIPRSDPDPPDIAIDAVMQVLAALRATELGPDAPALSMVGVDAPTGPSTRRLLEVAHQKVARYGDQLRAVVPGFDGIWKSVQAALVQPSTPGHYAVHGDLVPPNILLGEDRTVSAVLDWGFLSHAGDPVFETAVTSGIFDMYGPHHRRIDDVLMERCVADLGDDRERLSVYRALYAIMTSHAYAEDGRDGHFAWCVAMLNRLDVRAAVGA
jgi:aminoglycoside phosphotransferase (APT) family kinase protein